MRVNNKDIDSALINSPHRTFVLGLLHAVYDLRSVPDVSARLENGDQSLRVQMHRVVQIGRLRFNLQQKQLNRSTETPECLTLFSPPK